MKRRSAFTLVEVLAAIVVISIVVPVAMQGVLARRYGGGAERCGNPPKRRSSAESKLAEVTTQTTLMAGTQGGAFDTMPGYSWQGCRRSAGTWDCSEVTVQVTWTAWRRAPDGFGGARGCIARDHCSSKR